MGPTATMKLFLLSLAIGCLFRGVHSFHVAPRLTSTPVHRPSSSVLFSTAAPEDVATASKKAKLLKRDRYVATNRFTVRPGRGAKFEKRWANRTSRLASLDGFRYFHLMRRVSLDNDVNSGIDPSTSLDPFGNYVSFTIWEEKRHFAAWRKGDAFMEAHGGTSLFAFVTAMVSSARVLRGAPKPAFYDGLLHRSVAPETPTETVDGWRSVEADGVNLLPAECFVATDRFFVPPQSASEFERRWEDRASELEGREGFVSFSMLRRDVRMKGHGTSPVGDEEPTYTSCTVWRDRAAFEGWKGEEEGDGGKDEKGPPAPLWSKPPVPVFYEGTLVITSPGGA